jgi:hypothetical protein
VQGRFEQAAKAALQAILKCRRQDEPYPDELEALSGLVGADAMIRPIATSGEIEAARVVVDTLIESAGKTIEAGCV